MFCALLSELRIMFSAPVCALLSELSGRSARLRSCEIRNLCEALHAMVKNHGSLHLVMIVAVLEVTSPSQVLML
jgi:hypothetical protein